MTTAEEAIQGVHQDVMSGAFEAVADRFSDGEDLPALVGRTLVALERGDDEGSHNGAEAALDVAQNVTQSPLLRGWALWLAGIVEGTIGGRDAAILCMQRAAGLFAAAECLEMAARCRGFAAQMVCRMGDTAQAVQLYESLVAAPSTDGVEEGVAQLFSGQLHVLKGNFEAASARLEAAHRAFLQTNCSVLATHALFDLATLAGSQGHFVVAERIFRTVMVSFEDMGATRRYYEAVCSYAVVQQWMDPEASGSASAIRPAIQQCAEGGVSAPCEIRFWHIWLHTKSVSQRSEAFDGLLKEATEHLLKQAAVLCHLGLLDSCSSHDIASIDFHLGRMQSLLEQYTQPDRNIAIITETIAKRLLDDGLQIHRWRACRLLETAFSQWKGLGDVKGLERIERLIEAWRTLESGVCLGPYDLVARLGSGPFGESWRGRVSRTGNPVILRVMNARALPRRSTQRKVKETIDRLAQIHHPSLAGTLGVEETTAFTERVTNRGIRLGTMVLVSVARPDFKHHVPTCGEGLFQTVCTVLQGLSVLHRHGFLHLSLTPDSIWTQPQGSDRTVCIADYVLPDLLRTAMGARLEMADFPFLAPEQCQGTTESVGPWSDLYSFGMVVYWWLFEALFDPENPVFDVPAENVPQGVGRWLSLLLASHPADRFQSAMEALAAWWSVFGQEGPMLAEQGDIESFASVDDDATREIIVPGQVSEEETPTVVVSRSSELQDAGLSAETTIRVAAHLNENTKTLSGFATVSEPSQWGRTLHPPKYWHRVIPETPAIEDPRRALQAFQEQSRAMYGRHEQRDALWAAVRKTSVTHRVQLCAVEGAPGVGKTRLIDWLEEALHRWGGAELLRCSGRDSQTLIRSLAKGLLVHLGCYGLRTPQVHQAIQRAFPQQTTVFHRTLTHQLAVQAGLSMDVQGTHPHALAILMDAVCLLSEHRLMVLCLDEYNPLCGMTPILARLVSSRHRMMVLVAGEQTVFEAPIAADVRCELMPLRHAEMMQLIRTLLPVHLDLAEQLASLSAGCPSFIVQWLDEWTSTQALRQEKNQLTLREGVRLDGPETLKQTWQRRLSRAFQDRSIQASMGMLLGAVWGMTVPKEIWLQVCESEHIFDPLAMVTHLSSQGLVWVDENAWGFSDVRFHQACIIRAKDLGEYPRLNRMYLAYFERSGFSDSRKYASLCVEGGAYARALPKLRRFAQEALIRDRVSEAAHSLMQMRRCVGALSLPESDEMVGRIALLTIDLTKRQDPSFEPTSELMAWFKAAEQHGWRNLLGMGYRMLGQAHRWAGQFSESNDAFRTALRWAETKAHTVEISQCCYGLGVNARVVGDFERAESLLQTVLDNEAEHPDIPLNVFACTAMAACQLGMRRYEMARESFRQAGKTAARLGYQNLVGDALMGEGEVAKTQGYLDQAWHLYQQALATVSVLAHSRRAIIEMNVCTIMMAEGHLDEAGTRLLPVLSQCRQLGLEQPVLCIEVFLLPYWVGRKSQEEWGAHFDAVQVRVMAAQLVDVEFALAYESALARVVQYGWSAVIRKPYSAACDQWKRLHRQGRLHSLKAQYHAALDFEEDS